MVPVIAEICLAPGNVPHKTYSDTFLVLCPILGKITLDLPRLPYNSHQLFEGWVDVFVDGKCTDSASGLGPAAI